MPIAKQGSLENLRQKGWRPSHCVVGFGYVGDEGTTSPKKGSHIEAHEERIKALEKYVKDNWSDAEKKKFDQRSRTGRQRGRRLDRTPGTKEFHQRIGAMGGRTNKGKTRKSKQIGPINPLVKKLLGME